MPQALERVHHWLHPDVFGRVLQWTREGGVHTDVVTMHTLNLVESVNSPVQALPAGAARVRQRLERGEVDHPQLAPLRAAGAPTPSRWR